MATTLLILCSCQLCSAKWTHVKVIGHDKLLVWFQRNEVVTLSIITALHLTDNGFYCVITYTKAIDGTSSFVEVAIYENIPSSGEAVFS